MKKEVNVWAEGIAGKANSWVYHPDKQTYDRVMAEKAKQHALAHKARQRFLAKAKKMLVTRAEAEESAWLLSSMFNDNVCLHTSWEKEEKKVYAYVFQSFSKPEQQRFVGDMEVYVDAGLNYFQEILAKQERA